MRSELRAAACGLVLAAVAGAPAPARSDEAALLRRLEELEQRVHELEAEAAERERADAELSQAEAPAPEASGSLRDPARETATDWTRYVRIGGSGNAGYYYGQDDTPLDHAGFEIWDARFFVDAELGDAIRLGDTVVARNAGITFEWDLVRTGSLRNDVGEFYVEFQGLAESPWANAQVGRFQIPVGEAYLRYSRGYADKPFISSPVGGPWWWDEGVKLYGQAAEGRIGYVASVTDGETPFNVDVDADKQVTLKLWADPLPWAHVSISGLRSGGIGSSSDPASGALWLGEMWARAFGSGSGVDNYIHGAAVPDGPNKLHDSYLGAVDVILHRSNLARLWLGYGAYHIDSASGSLYDRTLHTWVGELLLEGEGVSPALQPFYAGFRASGVGTYDDGEGYLLDRRYAGELGYNMQRLEAYSTVLGWRMTRFLNLRVEYTHQEIALVDGVPSAVDNDADDADYVGVELGGHF